MRVLRCLYETPNIRGGVRLRYKDRDDVFTVFKVRGENRGSQWALSAALLIFRRLIIIIIRD